MLALVASQAQAGAASGRADDRCIAGRRYARTFHTEFATEPWRLGDGGRWSTAFPWGPMNPRGGDAAYYLSPSVDPLVLRVQGGALDLSARPTPASLRERVHDAAFVSGLVTTARAQGAPTFRQRFGYVEVRARLPAGRGLWPAFWLRDAFGREAEIDVFELLGDDPHTLYQSVHHVDGHGSSFAYRLPFDPTSAFHDYGVQLTARHDTWYVDGTRTHEVNDASAGPLYPIVSMQVGARGSWPGPPDGTTAWPATLSLKRFVAYRDAGPCPTPTARSSPRR